MGDSRLEERFWIDRLVLNTTLVSFVILLFDHVLTIGDEIEYIWRRKITVINVLYLVNRYFTLAAMVVYMIGVTSIPMTTVDGGTPQSDGTNIRPVLVLVLLTVVSMLIAEFMLILRVSAVYCGNKPILVLLVFLWIAHLATMSFFAYEASLFLSVRNISNILFIKPASGVWLVVPAVVFDMVVGLLLSVGLYRRLDEHRIQMPLVQLIIRDGTLYFFVVFASNLAWVLVRFILQIEPDSVVRESDFTSLEIWSACITTTMIGRLTLNLKEYNPSDDQDELAFRTLTRIQFRTRVSHPSMTFERAGADYHYQLESGGTVTQ